jgi:hypothetical protein
LRINISTALLNQMLLALTLMPHLPNTPPLASCTLQALRPGAATTLDVETLEAVGGDAPSATLPRDQVAGVTLAELMVTTKLQPSKGAARKWVQGLSAKPTVGSCLWRVEGVVIPKLCRTEQQTWGITGYGSAEPLLQKQKAKGCSGCT